MTVPDTKTLKPDAPSADPVAKNSKVPPDQQPAALARKQPLAKTEETTDDPFNNMPV
jgi:hypothetical protein